MSASGAAAASSSGAGRSLFLTDQLFTSLALDTRVWKCLSSMRLARMSRVQAEAIPALLGGSNCIVKAKTGSGKTLAYAVPIVQQILHEQEANPNAAPGLSHIVLLPSHELVAQVRTTLQSLLKFCSDCVRVVALRGGDGDDSSNGAAAKSTRQFNEAQMREGHPNIVVATPSQLLNYCRSAEKSVPGSLAALRSSLKHLVLDEADLLLGMGYEDELTALLSLNCLGQGFQISLFSATLDPSVERLQNVYLGTNASVIDVDEGVDDAFSGAAGGQRKLTEFYHSCTPDAKYRTILALMMSPDTVLSPGRRLLFFVAKIEDAYRLVLFLGHFGLRAAVLNHQLPANSRQNIVEQFNRQSIDVLIATDAAAEVGDEDLDDAATGKKKKGTKRGSETAAKEEAEEEGETAVKDEEDAETGASSSSAAAASSAADADADDASMKPSARKKAKKTAAVSAALAAAAEAASKLSDADMPPSVKAEDLRALIAFEAAPANAPASGAMGRTSRRYRGHNHWGKEDAASTAKVNLSRGVDFKDVDTVINFDFPPSTKSYIHRIGRTARADRSGVALSFVCTEDEASRLGAVMDTQVERAVLAGIPRDEASPFLQALPLSAHLVEGFRYRADDKLRAVTRLAIREEQMSWVKKELVNSARLAAHWEDNPRELQLLQHDRVLKGSRPAAHLAVVPSYLLPEESAAAASASSISAAARAASATADANRNKLRRNKHKLAVGAANAKSKLNLEKMSGVALAKAKGRHTMATKNALNPLRSFNARSLGGAGTAAFGASSAAAAASGAGKAKVDF